MKHRQLPDKYREGFLKGLDQRTEIFGRLISAYESVLTDMGDPATLTHARKALAERFVFLQFMLQGLEKQIAEASESNPKRALRLFSRWVQGLNAIVGLARSAGLLSKNAKPITNLREYVRSNHRQERKDSM